MATLTECKKLAKLVGLTVTKTFDPHYPYYAYLKDKPVMRFTTINALKVKLLILSKKQNEEKR
jgi:hypothetical protein